MKINVSISTIDAQEGGCLIMIEELPTSDGMWVRCKYTLQPSGGEVRTGELEREYRSHPYLPLRLVSLVMQKEFPFVPTHRYAEAPEKDRGSTRPDQ